MAAQKAAPNPVLGTRHRIPRSKDDQSTRPYWKWEGKCPLHEQCEWSKKSWPNVWKISYQSHDHCISQIATHLTRTPLHKMHGRWLQMADAEQICTSWVDEHFNVVEYWETFEDREELRDWDAQHGKPDTTTLGSALSADTCDDEFQPIDTGTLRRKKAARAWGEAAHAAAKRRRRERSAAHDAPPPPPPPPPAEPSEAEEEEEEEEEHALALPGPRTLRRKNAVGDIEIIVRQVLDAVKAQPKATEILVPVAKLKKVLKAARSTQKMLEQMKDIAKTMDIMAGAELEVLKMNQEILESVIQNQTLGI